MHYNDPILIFGVGSIGERHIRNLWALGYRNIKVFRQRNLPFRDIADAALEVITDKEDLDQTTAQVAFICTPTVQHAEQILYCAHRGIHVFTEKPMTADTQHMEKIQNAFSEKNLLLQVGFMMRFHPAMQRIRHFQEENTYGALRRIRSHWGSYLPDWHPWENYKESYAARQDLGGGVALTLCHDIDLAIWIAGMQQSTFTCVQKKDARLDIDAPSIADILLVFPNGTQADIHLNYLDNPPVRRYHFQFEKAEIDIPYFENKMIMHTADGETEITQYPGFDRNDMFMDELRSFFQQLSTTADHRSYSQQQIRESANITDICTL